MRDIKPRFTKLNEDNSITYDAKTERWKESIQKNFPAFLVQLNKQKDQTQRLERINEWVAKQVTQRKKVGADGYSPETAVLSNYARGLARLQKRAICKKQNKALRKSLVEITKMVKAWEKCIAKNSSDEAQKAKLRALTKMTPTTWLMQKNLIDIRHICGKELEATNKLNQGRRRKMRQAQISKHANLIQQNADAGRVGGVLMSLLQGKKCKVPTWTVYI